MESKAKLLDNMNLENIQNDSMFDWEEVRILVKFQHSLDSLRGCKTTKYSIIDYAFTLNRDVFQIILKGYMSVSYRQTLPHDKCSADTPLTVLQVLLNYQHTTLL